MLVNILQYLEKTVERVPDKTAFSDGKESMTFRQLYDSARAAGSVLSSRGYYGEPVMVMAEKSPHELAAFLGAVYAGCFYTAPDPDMPVRRLGLITEAIKPRIIICDDRYEAAARALDYGAEVINCSSLFDSAVDTDRLEKIRARQIDTDPIYIVFTSGSTGVPKGVVACHRSVIDYTESLCEAIGFDSDTVFGNQTPLYFDAPLKEIMPTLRQGATTYFIPKQLFMFPVKLCDFLNQYRINTICWVVSALTVISSLGALEKNPPCYLRCICFGSEVFPRRQYDLWRSTLPDTVFFNLYGPTEATGMSCYWKADRELLPDETIPVGRPFRNTGIILLDEQNNRVQDGGTGEICMRGTCVTLGYYANPEKTSEAFVQNPLNTKYPEIIYRTGDLGRYNEHGELVFVSRKDSQIKHMGHRIELGEIEAAAATCTSVSRACCVYDDEKKRIIMFYTGDIKAGELNGYMKELVPRYMIPAEYRQLDRLPLTANCKLDRRLMKQWITE